ncbi:DUF342 domain-containing protein [Gorillibacterium sp. sgz5001074]|uniref:DUF342 domain-containing protein n=1 Tax=Gorillibacterium sp. sgz5001074 TaxID=3446695 RepID=UPI003F66DDA3
MSKYISEDELVNLVKKLSVDPADPAPDLPEYESRGSVRAEGKGLLLRVEDNKVLLVETDQSQGYPTVQALPPVQLLRNGKVCTDPILVMPGDKLDWQIAEEPLFTVEVSEDRLCAYLQVKRKNRCGWRLLPREDRQQLLVEAERDESMVLETVRLADVMKALSDRKITKNIRTSAIFQELQMPTGEKVPVAHGVDKESSVDARLEIYFSEEIENVFCENERTGTVDYRNHARIPSVKKGDLIARKIPMKQGVMGYDVYGDLIRPAPPKDITVIAKDHVEIRPDGGVYALKDGRPRVTGSEMIKYFDITTAYVISGNVDLKTGNIVFSGDVVVYGDVTEGMIVESLGNVYVFGSVYQATITATGSITVKGNIINSNLYSGYFGVIFNRLYVSCKALDTALGNLRQAGKLLVDMIESRGQVVRIGQVMNILIESKFKDVPELASDCLVSIRSLQRITESEMEELKEKLKLLIDPHKILAFDSFNHLYAIQNHVHETHQMIERMQESYVFIDIAQCHLSNLKSTGDIFIRKEGVLRSNLYGKGNIAFFDSHSVCRGGEIEALGIISAMTVGGDVGGETHLKAGKRVTLQRMHYGRITIGKHSRVILEPMSQVQAYLDQNRFVLEGTAGDS